MMIENRLGRFDHGSSCVIDARDKSSIPRGVLLFLDATGLLVDLPVVFEARIEGEVFHVLDSGAGH